MKNKINQPGAELHSGTAELSRRKFLQTAAAGVVAASVPVSGMAQNAQPDAGSKPQEPIEKILQRYGSELGHIKQIG